MEAEAVLEVEVGVEEQRMFPADIGKREIAPKGKIARSPTMVLEEVVVAVAEGGVAGRRVETIRKNLTP